MRKILLFTLALIGTMSVWGATATIKTISSSGEYGSSYNVTSGNTDCNYALKVTNSGSGSGTINVTIDGVTLENKTVGSNNWGVAYVGAGCDVTLKNCTLHNYSTGAGIKCDDGSSLTLENCTIYVDAWRSYASSAVAAMYGSNITVKSGRYESAGPALIVMGSGGTITVEDGYFKGSSEAISDQDFKGAIYIDQQGSNNSTVNIQDGIFDGSIYVRYNSNYNTLKIDKGVFLTNAMYGQKYAKLADCPKYEASSRTLYTADNMTFANYTAYTGSSIDDVKPYANYAAAVAANEHSINILEGQTISEPTTIGNLSITAKGSFDALTVTGGTLTVDGATINAASGQNGIYVNGGNLIAQSSAVLNGGTNAVYVKSGDCTIQGSATANAGIYVDGGSLIAQGSAVLNTVNVNAGSFDVPESTTITAGTLTKAAGEGATISLKSGTYSQDVTDYVADGYKSTKLSDTQWKVEEDKPYTRDVTIGAIGTICLNKDVKAGDFSGAIFYKTAYRISDTRIYFDEVDALEAGKAYIFEATAAKISCKLSGTTADAPIAENGLYGTFEGINYSADPAGQASESDETLKNMYLVNNDIIRLCGKGCWLAPNRAYINLSEVTDKATPAPGRRISLVNNDANIATFVEEVGAAAQGVKKAMINGQLVIIKDGKMFNAQGAEL